MQKLLPLILLGLIAAACTLFAAAADEKERDRSKAGAGASTEGGASLGGTGIDSGVSNQRGTDDPDKRLKLQRKPKPAEERKDPAEPRKPAAEHSGASTGATQPRGSLSEEADKQDEEFRKKQDAQRRK